MTEFQALLLSIAIESPIAYLVVRYARWPGRGPVAAAIAATVATAVTHPQAWAAADWLTPQYGWLPVALGGEVLVIIAEGVMIGWMTQMKWRHAMLLSAVNNTASFVVGLFVLL